MKLSKALTIIEAILLSVLIFAPSVHGAELEDTCFEKGNNLMRSQSYDEAAQQFETVVRLNPNRSDAFYRLGLCYGRMQQYHRAIQALNTTLYLEPENTLAQKLLKIYLEKIHQSSKGKSNVEIPEGEATVIQQKVESPSVLENTLSESNETKPTDNLTPLQRLQKAIELKSQGNNDEALRIFEKILLAHPDILAYDDGGLLDDLKAKYDAVIANRESSLSLLFKAVDIYLCLNEIKTAIGIYQRVLYQLLHEADRKIIRANISKLQKQVSMQNDIKAELQQQKAAREKARQMEEMRREEQEWQKSISEFEARKAAQEAQGPHCGNCGSYIADQSSHLCPSCHAKWQYKVSKYCGNCGHSLPDYTKPGYKCPHCGAINY